jgi:hypothetical protein
VARGASAARRARVVLIAPSRWAADTLARFYPSARVRVVPHGIPEMTPRHAGTRLAVMLPDDGVPTVAVLGAVGPDKGARRIERLVELARERGSSVRFVLIGYLDRQHTAWQSDDARFTVHGRYDPRDLPDLLAHYRVSLVLYPSAGPETFSYTLSEAWSAGRPVLVPPIGALPERVSPTGAGWVLDDAEWRDERHMLDRIEALLASSRADDLARASRRPRRAPHLAGSMAGDARLLRERPARPADQREPPAFARARSRCARLPPLEPAIRAAFARIGACGRRQQDRADRAPAEAVLRRTAAPRDHAWLPARSAEGAAQMSSAAVPRRRRPMGRPEVASPLGGSSRSELRGGPHRPLLQEGVCDVAQRRAWGRFH